MAFSIKNPEADRLARELAEKTGETLTGAVLAALRDKLDREKVRSNSASVVDAVREFQESIARLPVLDTRSADEILGYDQDGLPS